MVISHVRITSRTQFSGLSLTSLCLFAIFHYLGSTAGYGSHFFCIMSTGSPNADVSTLMPLKKRPRNTCAQVTTNAVSQQNDTVAEENKVNASKRLGLAIAISKANLAAKKVENEIEEKFAAEECQPTLWCPGCDECLDYKSMSSTTKVVYRSSSAVNAVPETDSVSTNFHSKAADKPAKNIMDDSDGEDTVFDPVPMFADVDYCVPADKNSID